METTPVAFIDRQTMMNQTFEIFHYKDCHLSEIQPHHHDFYELYLFLDGNVKYMVESRVYPLCSGDLLLMSPSEMHQPIIGRSKVPYERLVLWISTAFMEEVSRLDCSLAACFLQQKERRSNLLHLSEKDFHHLQHLMFLLFEETQTDRYGHKLCCTLYVTQILLFINRLCLNADQYEEITGQKDDEISPVLDYISAHLDEPLSLDSLSRTFYFNRSTLSRRFQKVTGVSIYQYITQKRLQSARQKLAAGGKPKDVYTLCGFKDYSNFYRAFVAQYGTSPKEYIEQLKNAQHLAKEMFATSSVDKKRELKYQ